MVLRTQDDPSVRMLRSGFGGQVKSTNCTEPQFGFGTGHRDASDKVCPVRNAANKGRH